MRSTNTISANSNETTPAAAIDANSESPGDPTLNCMPMPASAPTSISPSTPSASTPLRSISIRPSAASANGTAKSGALPSQWEISSINVLLPECAAGDGG
ncbi:hypothetical protein ALO94_200025 [Pseudomonas syringae pv. spinaceae]|uniref:Coronafacic acid synthetase n=1 Tax=Pseudomonas syringae pv. spinaceae TaxID=264459 RepID=A0A0Q0CBS1_PSESX|nr:hypothetical protein ALO94_200025 [Pseudomonas syringae pv. spinaceae]